MSQRADSARRACVIVLAALLAAGLCSVGGAQVRIVAIDDLGDSPHDGIARVSHGDLGQGIVGMVFGEGSYPEPRSIYLQQLDLYGQSSFEVVTSHTGSMYDAELVVDSAGEPHVLVDYMVYEGGYRRRVLEYVRDLGAWTPTLAFDSTDNNAVLVAAGLGPGDSVHAVMCNRYQAKLYYASNATGGWQWETLPQEADTQNVGAVDLVVDTGGHAHIAYDVENLASSPPQRSEMRYLSNTTGAWVREVVFAQGNAAYSLHLDPSLTLDGGGMPIIASSYGETAATGSLLYSELRLNRRVGVGSWTSEVVADVADGFAASDGPHFTGWNPVLMATGDGHAHLMFSDMACWHSGGSQYCQRGQLRYAEHDGGQWSGCTLYQQTVNTSSYLDRLRIDAVVFSEQAQRFFTFAYEGSPDNAGWTGTFTLLRLHAATPGVVFLDGFESGGTSAWSGTMSSAASARASPAHRLTTTECLLMARASSPAA